MVRTRTQLIHDLIEAAKLSGGQLNRAAYRILAAAPVRVRREEYDRQFIHVVDRILPPLLGAELLCLDDDEWDQYATMRGCLFEALRRRPVTGRVGTFARMDAAEQRVAVHG